MLCEELWGFGGGLEKRCDFEGSSYMLLLGDTLTSLHLREVLPSRSLSKGYRRGLLEKMGSKRGFLCVGAIVQHHKVAIGLESSGREGL